MNDDRPIAPDILKELLDLSTICDKDDLLEAFSRIMGAYWPSLSYMPADQAPQNAAILPMSANDDSNDTIAVLGGYAELAATERAVIADAVRLLGIFLNGCKHSSRTEAALRASEKRHRTIFENSPLGMILYAPDGTILDCNDKFVELMGSSRHKLIGFNTATQTTSDMRASIRKALNGSTAVYEDYYSSVTGNKSLYLRVRFNPVHPGQSPSEVIATLEDVTDRKNDEKRLRASEKRFKNLLVHMEKVAVQGYDAERRVIFWNKASEEIYGYSSEEAMGRRLEDLIIPAPMRDDVVAGIQAWVDGGAAIPAGELVLQRKDGSPVTVFSSHVMQENIFSGKEMFCVDVDLSEIKKAHNQLVLAKEAAEAASRAKTNFLANMSHEIRTPLNGILGMLQLMQSTDLDASQEKYTSAALQSSMRLTRLLSDILDLTKVEAGKLTFQESRFDLGDTFRHVADLFESASRQSGVEVRTVIDTKLPQHLVGDQTRLSQILTNLVGNALKFTSEGSVTMEANQLSPIDTDQCRVLFSVSDTGIGISDDKLAEVFEPFTQGAEGFTRKFQGAGLGLSICKRLVALMGGNLSVESEEGRGTTIHFSLGLGYDATMQDAPSAVTPATTPPMSILLVEDDTISNMATGLLLEHEGHTVTTVSNGEEALAILDKEAFDMVLMDVQMPVMDGLEATKAIREGMAGHVNKTIPIIAMTAYAMSGDRERILDSGMDDYVAKPIRSEDLKAAINRLASTLPH